MITLIVLILTFGKSGFRGISRGFLKSLLLIPHWVVLVDWASSKIFGFPRTFKSVEDIQNLFK